MPVRLGPSAVSTKNALHCEAQVCYQGYRRNAFDLRKGCSMANPRVESSAFDEVAGRFVHWAAPLSGSGERISGQLPEGSLTGNNRINPLYNIFFAECELLHTSPTVAGCSYMAGSAESGGLCELFRFPTRI
jgi:hypothetical protein